MSKDDKQPSGGDGDTAFATEVVDPASPIPKEEGYLKCTLCNNIIDDDLTHTQLEHPHVVLMQELLENPLPPLPSNVGRDDVDALAVGTFAVAVSSKADQGEAAFCVIQRAQAQLNSLLDGVQQSNGHVFPFGSVVSLGSWDGTGDGDFTFVCPKWHSTPDGVAAVSETVEDDRDETEVTTADPAEVVEDGAVETTTVTTHHVNPTALGEGTATSAPVSRKLSSQEEKKMILGITARLRGAGFLFDELEPVLGTRIPVLRRKQVSHDPFRLHAAPKASRIRVRFYTAEAQQHFRSGKLQAWLSTYKATELPLPLPDNRNNLLLSIPDPIDALHLMSRRERNVGFVKEWFSPQYSPDIFALDFDLSCRLHGVRNSWLLRRYLEQDEVFRMGNVFLKNWSKACGINNSRLGYLTSYAISVLWIYFLLRCDEVTFVDPQDVPPVPEPERQSHVEYIPLWPPLPEAEDDVRRTRRLGGLLRGFFYFYGNEFDWETHVVSIRQPCGAAATLRSKADLGWTESLVQSFKLSNRCYHIFSIEDVYEDDLDLGRHLAPEKASWTRLQFRLAYQRCCGVETDKNSSLWSLLDVPQKRAGEVLSVHLFRYLLQNTNNGSALAAEVLEELFDYSYFKEQGEDPRYLFVAYELGNRLSDLWFNHAQARQDAAYHAKHDRRSTDFTPAVDPTTLGHWAVVCKDNAQESISCMDKLTQVHLSLEPPLKHRTEPGTASSDTRSAPARERALLLLCAQRQFQEYSQELCSSICLDSGDVPAMVVGLRSPASVLNDVSPRCFYALQQQRFFHSYEARAVFVRCARAVLWELARLHGGESAVGDQDGPLYKRDKLYQHLKRCIFSNAVLADGDHEAVLRFLCSETESYIKAFPHPPTGAILFDATNDLLTAAGVTRPIIRGNVKAAAVKARPPPKKALPLKQLPDKRHEVKKSKKGISAEEKHRDPDGGVTTFVPPAPRHSHPMMNQRGRKMGTCGECGKPNVVTFPSKEPQYDSGYYCAQCWSNYA